MWTTLGFETWCYLHVSKPQENLMAREINYEPWGSHSKFADVWMHKLRGFTSSKLRVTFPIKQRQPDLLVVAREISYEPWGSHSKFADIWMHKLWGFTNSKLWVTFPIKQRQPDLLCRYWVIVPKHVEVSQTWSFLTTTVHVNVAYEGHGLIHWASSASHFHKHLVESWNPEDIIVYFL